MRLIDADKLKTSLNKTVDAAIKWHEDCLGEIMQNRSEAAITAFIECILRVEEQLTIDAVEVVRCKDCKHWERGTIDEQDNFISPKCAIQTSTHDARHADDFCSWAERKERKQ